MPLIGRIAAATARAYGLFSSIAQAVDPYFNYVVALLHGDGTNGGQNNTFLDSSTNNFTITRNGNTTQGSFSPFSQTGWSNYFDGTGDYLSVANNAAFQFGTGDFTVEAWVIINSAPASDARVYSYQVIGSTSVVIKVAIDSNRKLACFLRSTGGSGATTYTSSSTIPIGQWTHIAFTRSGTTGRIFVNGLLDQTQTGQSQDLTASVSAYVGTLDGSSDMFTGYISNIRVVKGTAVYTDSFTPSTTPLTAISGTSLLTCQSNRFLDASTNNFTITRNGDVSVQPFSPFNPTTAYSASSIGGSGYFDGSGDYLTTSPNAAFRPSGNFTIEAWVYLSTVSGIQNFFTTQDSNGFYQFSLGTNGTNARFTMGPYSGAYAVAINGGTLTTGAWFHIAVARSGTGSNNIRMWVNGSSVAQATSNATPGTETSVEIGREAFGGSNPFTGYMGGLRIVTGSAVYDPTQSTITVPTSPLTAVTNTSFLLNFTNGAIFDNAAVADYETVGNAQISTSVKKYGTGSMSFDGTGDYLLTDAPSTNLFVFGTGDFTIECWVYFNAVNATQVIYDTRPANTDGAYNTIYLNSSGNIIYYTQAADRITGPVLSASVWYHVAVCRIASQTKLFLNGTQVGSTYADTNSYVVATQRPVIGGNGSNLAVSYLNAYVDDLRVTKGVGRYAYNFTPPTAAFPNIGGTVTLTADPYYEYTTLLLPGNGTNGAQNNTFLDSSTNAFTITRNGNTIQGTFSPFSQTGWSAYFDGTGDYLVTPSNAALSSTLLGSDFTIETWLYLTAAPSGGAAIWTNSVSNSDGFSSSYVTTNLAIGTGKVGVNEFVTANNILALNQWNHFACVRNGATVYIYVNGTQVASGAASTYLNTSATKPMTFGSSYQTSPAAISGYFSNIRVVSSAVYTANFTPPAVPLTAISNTQLLTCQSNRFIDNSSNAFAITANGNVSVQAFSPFNPTASWSAATYGGSGYFDGSGDYLDLTPGAIGTGDFTLECWVYLNSNSTNQGILDTRSNSNTNGFALLALSTGVFQMADGISVIGSTAAAATGQWYHIAASRASSVLSFYVNGSRVGSTVANSTNFSNNRLRVGEIGGLGQALSGYISNARYSNTALYSGASITVPTAPLTGGVALLNFTNAGIYDATSKNDLETIGNAQISTTQSKFGGSSMYFDGNGDWLASVATAFGTFNAGDFTVECWIYSTVNQNSASIVSNRTSGVDTVWALEFYNNGTGNNILNWHSGTTIIMYANTAASINTWNHVAVVRFGTALKMYLNGREVASATDSRNYSSVTPIQVGYESFAGTSGIGYYNGYINDLRITKGIARYTSNFTPPTTAFLTL